MERTYWTVEIPLAGSGEWYELCTCETIDALTSIVASLMRAMVDGVHQIRINKRKRL